MVEVFEGVENILWEIFLPRLFFGEPKSLTPLIGTIITLPVKKSGLGGRNGDGNSGRGRKVRAGRAAEYGYEYVSVGGGCVGVPEFI